MRILIVTDAWLPQVNGVVQTLLLLKKELEHRNIETFFITPQNFQSIELSIYPGIHVALPRYSVVKKLMEDIRPDFIHLATEGTLGWAFRRYCIKNKKYFTTSYHSRFPEYFETLFGIPQAVGYAFEKFFHSASSGIMVSTSSLEKQLKDRNFRNILRWSRGVDHTIFRPRPIRLYGTEVPIFLYVGRISKEKNIDAFLKLNLPGKKVVVGDGPYLSVLRQSYPDVLFTGRMIGEELALHYASADVFVFPSRTDTFGLVLLEALASGLPVAAYPVTGPIDIIEEGISGFLNEDLGKAAVAALSLDRNAARDRALQFTWSASADQFLENIKSSITSGKELNVNASSSFFRTRYPLHYQTLMEKK
ncbi:MAG: glycosyltransferase family 4 protein [Hyphomicrobium sp.]